ncbi:ATPase (plasmid) [Deinococcus taeanensis]|uniref:N-acetylglucosamine kinase n=1 Tax=Deinococcus taeanensis TaxID=2737050 RepID=UPI001CDD75EB|nr:BadF/BadG/BcrA/BcrD ATPase family protein [Deinococcus taeanensis]UBV44837.1 ATPase [Deinococcus taeanensis]
MTPLPFSLGLDAGGSSTRWSLRRGGSTVASGSGPPLTTALLGTPAGQDSLQALRAALPATPEVAHAGLPGLSADHPDTDRVREALAAALGLNPARLSVESDLDLAYRAHLAPGSGVLLYAGTGSVAYHVTRGGEVIRAGGRGYRIGDDGAGFSLGRGALRALTHDLDHGRHPEGPLAQEVAAVTGGLDWNTLRAFAYSTPGAAGLATLAPAVGRAADQGDVRAQTLLQEAAQALAALARAVQERAGTLPVTATGGTLRVSPLLVAALGRALPGVNVQHRDHAEAAARYAESHGS